MNNTRRKPRSMADINVVPYIDVMLVLLIIFMVTAPMMMQGIEVEVPEVSSGILERDDEQDYLVVAVNAQGLIFIERGQDKPEAVPSSEVGQYVTTVLKQQPSLDVYIRADAAARYGTIMMVMATLQSAGITSVGLITEAPDDNA